VHQVGHYPELHQDARSTKQKITAVLFCCIVFYCIGHSRLLLDVGECKKKLRRGFKCRSVSHPSSQGVRLSFAVVRHLSFAFKDTLVDGLLMSHDSFFSAVLSCTVKLE
jgi:hypothetical protein